MRSQNARITLATFVLACSTLLSPIAAQADSTSTTSTTTFNQTTVAGWLSAEKSFVAHRHTIFVDYRNVVNDARLAFIAAVSQTHTNRARRAIRTTLATALATAGAVERSHLAELGDGPAMTSLLDTAESQLERQGINQNYADAIGADLATYRAEVAAAVSSADLVTARANLHLGIAQATTARSVALVELGAHTVSAGKSASSRGHLR